MSERKANCPACGAELTFANVASLLVVCSHCQYASFRKDLKLELVGKVAEVAPIDSPIALGVAGKLDGRAFRVVGQIQLDHGAGPWNEWNVLFDNGASGWIAEAQGQYLVTFEVPPVTVPRYAEIQAGAELDLGARGKWIVAEKGRGTVTAIRGELATDVRPGKHVQYADLSGVDGGFGTLDYGEFDTCEAIYLGVRRELGDLHLDTAGGESTARRKVAAERVECPKCAGAITLRDAENTKRVGCPYCGALLDPRAKVLEVLATSELFKYRPGPAIGARGVLDGKEYEVLAHLERSVTSEGERWPWDEFLLRRKDGAYRWLVCSQKHWTFVEPLNLADVSGRAQRCFWKGRTFKHFSGGVACVDRVLGEVYWEVRIGEKVTCSDYVDAPNMISFEESEGEKLVSLATYIDREVVQRAFGSEEPLKVPTTIGPAQPNPIKPRLGLFWKTFGALAVLLLVLGLGFGSMRGAQVVFQAQYPLPAKAAIVSDEFEITGWRTRAEIAITAPGLDTGYFEVHGALVGPDSGLHPFRITGPGALTGVAETTDRGTASVRLGALPSGRYRLRMETETGMKLQQGQLDVRVTTGHGEAGLAIGFIALLLVLPVLLSIAAGVFEGSRWSQSDHAG